MLLKTRLITLLITALLIGGVTPGFSAEPKLSPDDKAIIKQGGTAHLLLEVNSKVIIKEALVNLADNIRSILRRSRLRYSDLKVVNDKVQVTLKTQEHTEIVRELFKSRFPNVISQPDAPPILMIGMESGDKDEIIEAAISSAVIKIRERLAYRPRNDNFPLVQRIGKSNRIVIEYPADLDPDSRQNIRHSIPARFSLHVVNEREFKDGKIPVGSQALTRVLSFGAGKASDNISKKVIIRKRMLINRNNIRGVEVSLSRNGNPEIHLKLDRLGFQKIQALKGQKIAFVFGGRVIATPTIKGPFQNRTLILQGDFSLYDARLLTEKIMMTVTPTPLEVVREWVTPPGFNNTNLVGN